MTRGKKSDEGSLRARKTKLDEVDREILRLKLKNPKISMPALAEAVGMNRRSLWKRMREDIFQEALEYYQLSAIEIITRAKQRAAQKFEKLIDSEVDSVARQVCESILADVLPAKNIAVAHTGTVKHIYSMTDEVLLAEIEEISEELGAEEFAVQARSILGGGQKTSAPRALPDAHSEGSAPG